VKEKGEISAVAATDKCAHCGEPITLGDECLAYIEPNEKKTKNVIKMMIHQRCAEAFFGTGSVN
jgi:hypothetical protein